MKCKDCSYSEFNKRNGGANRYYCVNRAVAPEGHKMICRTKRHCEEITIKTSPRWCPLKGGGS